MNGPNVIKSASSVADAGTASGTCATFASCGAEVLAFRTAVEQQITRIVRRFGRTSAEHAQAMELYADASTSYNKYLEGIVILRKRGAADTPRNQAQQVIAAVRLFFSSSNRLLKDDAQPEPDFDPPLEAFAMCIARQFNKRTVENVERLRAIERQFAMRTWHQIAAADDRRQ
jgi:hypothetical protein